MLETPVVSGSLKLLELSSKVEYALLALLELASHPDKQSPLTIGEISAKHAIPDRYLEQILTSLRRAGLIRSNRGAKGGYLLIREPWQITLLEVITLMEGNRKERDQIQLPTTEQEVVYEVWAQANAASQAILSRYTLRDLCQRRDDRKQKNPMYYI